MRRGRPEFSHQGFKTAIFAESLQVRIVLSEPRRIPRFQRLGERVERRTRLPGEHMHDGNVVEN
jgi:hypothetical protein